MSKDWEKIKPSNVAKYVDKFGNIKMFLHFMEVDLAKYKSIQSLGFQPGEDILYLVTDLSRWCNEPNTFKLDFYLFEGEYHLCLKRNKDKEFKDEDIPEKIFEIINNIFRIYRNDSLCITLMDDCDGKLIASKLKIFLDDLSVALKKTNEL